MNRNHTQKQYLELVDKLRKSMPDVAITTDIIVGFPTETEEQFQDTLDVTEKVGYDMAFIAQYSPRPGTVSAKMADDVTKDEKKERESRLQKILAESSLEHNKKLVGTIQKVLIDEVKGDKIFGRTKGFKVVEIADEAYCSSNERTKNVNSSRQVSNDNKTDLLGLTHPVIPVIDSEVSELIAQTRRAQAGIQAENKTDLVGQFIEVKIESAKTWKLIAKIL